MSEGHGAVMPVGDFLLGVGETRAEERKKRTSRQNPWKTAVTLDAGATIGSGCDGEIGGKWAKTNQLTSDALHATVEI
jgi:hypothetical protein